MTWLFLAGVFCIAVGAGVLAITVLMASAWLACRRGERREAAHFRAVARITREHVPDYVPAEWTDDQ